MNTQADANTGWIEMVPGIHRRTLVSGDTMMQMLVTLEAGSRLPEHRHPQEQVAFVVAGRLRLSLDGGRDVHELGPNESLYLPANVPHAAEALEDTLVADTFSPPREDLLEQDRLRNTPRARV